MRVLLTGASGFLGSWVARNLAKTQHEVHCLVRPESSIWRLEGESGLQFHPASSQKWPELFEDLEPDAWVSLDWEGVGGLDRNHPSQSLNVARFNDLLERIPSPKVVIGTGSQAEIGPQTGIAKEHAPDNPQTKYALAKCQTRRLFEERFAGDETRFVWARVFSTYGPRDSDQWFLPSLLLKLIREEPAELTEGTQTWSFLHAEDAAQAFKTMLDDSMISGVVNVGNPETMTIREAAEHAGKLLDSSGLLLFGAVPYRTSETMRLEPEVKKLLECGWAPRKAFKDGLAELAAWLLERERSDKRISQSLL
jgi:nucleoside-diphosphate-sugar epimerase